LNISVTRAWVQSFETSSITGSRLMSLSSKAVLKNHCVMITEHE
jgi:hypothetical protein